MPNNVFIPALWADEIIEAFKRPLTYDSLLALLPPLFEDIMKLDPDLEAFFVAISLMHGTHPSPKFGWERVGLAQEIANYMRDHPGQPEVIARVRRNYIELGGKLLASDPRWFFDKLADAYLDWLYAQPESQELLPAVLDKLEQQRELTTRTRAEHDKKYSLKTIKW